MPARWSRSSGPVELNPASWWLPTMNEYEREREERIRKNREELARLTAGLQLPQVRDQPPPSRAGPPKR